MSTMIAGAIVLALIGWAIKALKKDGLGCPGCKGGCSGDCCHCSEACHKKH